MNKLNHIAILVLLIFAQHIVCTNPNSVFDQTEWLFLKQLKKTDRPQIEKSISFFNIAVSLKLDSVHDFSLRQITAINYFLLQQQKLLADAREHADETMQDAHSSAKKWEAVAKYSAANAAGAGAMSLISARYASNATTYTVLGIATLAALTSTGALIAGQTYHYFAHTYKDRLAAAEILNTTRLACLRNIMSNTTFSIIPLDELQKRLDEERARQSGDQ